MKIMDDNDNKGNFYFLNEGRWSYKEHIKFIEAIAEFGKNWKDVQKYVGSRSSTQARSHAQKFFLKLKAIKTSKFDFDFSNNNIRSLSDIIEIIKRKDEYLKRGKEYIISTLISLSESISIENNDLCNNFKKKIKKIKKDEHSQNIIIDNKKNKNDLFNVFTDNNGNSEKDKSTANNIELNIINSENKEKKINTNIIIENKNESKNIKSENIKEEKIEKEIETNKIRESDNNIKNTDSYTIKGNIQNNQNPVIYDDYFYEQKQPKYLFEDGIIYLSDNSEFFNLNDISLILKENNSIRNSELPYVIFNNHFFS
jgi:SHAQKYF class myb-like DNA-binding protein